ncbi:MAG: thioredoxin [Fidelibacterota bacterium]
MSETVLEFSDNNFETEVLKADQPVLVDFWAEWCGPCRVIGPTVHEIADEYAGKVKVGKVNVDHNQNIAMKYGIRSIPALLIFKGGTITDQIVGAVPKARITELLEKVI